MTTPDTISPFAAHCLALALAVVALAGLDGLVRWLSKPPPDIPQAQEDATKARMDHRRRYGTDG